MGKSPELPIIVSDDFAQAYGKPLTSPGRHQRRGLSDPHELIAPEAIAVFGEASD